MCLCTQKCWLGISCQLHDHMGQVSVMTPLPSQTDSIHPAHTTITIPRQLLTLLMLYAKVKEWILVNTSEFFCYAYISKCVFSMFTSYNQAPTCILSEMSYLTARTVACLVMQSLYSIVYRFLFLQTVVSEFIYTSLRVWKLRRYRKQGMGKVDIDTRGVLMREGGRIEQALS